MQNKPPFVSVIMNCFNCEKYLKQAVESVLNQSFQDWEIVFWDNQSSDQSAKNLKSFKDPRIKYFCAEEHTTLGEARNLVVEKSTGEWLAFLDCDDIWFKEKLSLQVALIKGSKQNIGLVYGRMEPLIEKEGGAFNLGKRANKNKEEFKTSVLLQGDVFDKLLFECFIPLPSAMVRKDLFDKVGGIDSHFRVAEDYDLFLKIAEISTVAAIDEVCCLYRIHDSNLSHKDYSLTFDESIQLISRYAELMPLASRKALKLWYARYLVSAIRNKDWSIFKQTRLLIKMIISLPSLIFLKLTR